MDTNDMHSFLSNLPESLECLKLNGREHVNFEAIQLQTSESLYVIDFSENRLAYSRGFENTWGYRADEIDLDLIIENVHPEDKELVHRIGMICIQYAIEHPKDNTTNLFSITYRCMKKNGEYGWYLSQSVILKANDQGVMLQALVKLTDISFFESSKNVFWDFKYGGLNKKNLKKLIYANEIKFFTKRERDIIRLLKKGYTNNQISLKLFISENTVSTHRKNIMKKSGCHNLGDLLEFCRSKGL